MSRDPVAEVFSRFGREVRLGDDNGWSSEIYRAFIQPLRYKNKMYLDGVYTVIGFDNQGKYLYLGPPSHDLTGLDVSSDYIYSDSVKYTVDRAEKVYNGDVPVYIWAIIREIVEVE